MILVALAVLVSTGFGVLGERRWGGARSAARAVLAMMLYALVPFVAFVTFAHLTLSAGAGAGLAIAYLGVACAGCGAWLVGRRLLELPRPRSAA